ncbi:MAG TPA: DUF4139 domain-containing protein [Bacteroidia bacterium]|jgi:uncharacterized protein (TIGR02231 family)|nr:DUF4139 domain-containing protein [Bacteroidia bacterium]
MKKIIFSAFALGALSVNAQTTLDLTPSVKKVTVYVSGAVITHEIQAQLQEGKTTVVFHGLPADMDNESIQLSSTGDITILSVTANADYLSDVKKNARTKKMSDSIEVLNDEIERVKNNISIMESGKSLLDNNRNTAGANTGTNAVTVKAMYDYYVREVERIDDSLMLMHKKEKAIQLKLDRLNGAERELLIATAHPNCVEAIVSADHAQSLDFRLSYLTNDAGWSPNYDLRAKDIKHSAELTYKADVHQNTGTDWSNIDLTLSTSNPNVSQTAPVLNANYLYFQNVYNEVAKSRAYYESSPAPVANNSISQETNLQDVVVTNGAVANSYTSNAVASTTNESQLSVEFHIDLPYSLPSDGKTHSVEVKKMNLPAIYRYQATPKLKQDAFLMADVTDWENLDLLPGQVNIYYAGAYVGKSYITAQSITDTISFSLGMDKKIAVKRERVKELCSTKWIGTNKTQVFTYSVTIRNSHPDSLKMEVFDQVPVTTDKDIQITVSDNGGAKQNTDTGKLTWKLSLAPGEAKKLTFSYSVKYPKDKIVENLN